MAARSVEEATIVEGAVAKALSEAGVKDDSPLKQVLVHDAEVYDLVEVCTPSSIDGRSVSLEQRLVEMKADPQWAREFKEKPAPSSSRQPTPTPAGAILQPDRSQFSDLVSGKAVMR
jgi:hypothetical protein